MIRLRFCGYSSFTSSVIRFAEGGGWTSHVECVAPNGRHIGAHSPDGVQSRLPGYDTALLTRELFVDLVDSEAHADAFYAFVLAQIGKAYDYEGLMGYVFRQRDWREEDSWYCSELISRGLEVSSYWPRLYSVTNHVSPRDDLLIVSARQHIEELGEA